MTESDPTRGSDVPEHRPALLRVFGHEPSRGTARVRARSRGWRLGRTLLAGGAGLTLAPLVALVPPHAPWALGALGLGAWLARRRWRERATLLGVEAGCPRCEAPLEVSSPAPLRVPHTLHCEGCRHDVSLEVEVERS